MFGVGVRNEALSTSGITHAVEHLALHALGPQSYAWNGAVGPVSTRFLVAGRSEDVIDFLLFVARQLRNLPVERLEEELRILQIEGKGREYGQVQADVATRFGPNDVGLIGWPEYGLFRLDADELRRWADHWFSAQNAVLWIAGPLPSGLRLDELPQGQPVSRSGAPRVLPPPRSWLRERARSVSISVMSTGERWGTGPAMQIARERAMDRLRRRDAISYQIDTARLRIGDGRSLDVLHADGSEGSYRRVFDGLTAILEEFADGGPNNDELERFRQARRQFLDDPQAVTATLDNAAERHLLGLGDLTLDQVEERFDQLTTQDLRDDLAAVLPTALAIGPLPAGESIAGWHEHEDWSPNRFSGVEYQPIEGREHGTLIVGPDGLSWVRDPNRVRSVAWDEVLASVASDGGVRQVIGKTGVSVVVAPWNWQRGHELTERVDGSIDPTLCVPMGDGAPHYRVNPDDPDSLRDFRWLGTVIGARHDSVPVDLVFDTDGIFLLYFGFRKTSATERLNQYQRLDRDTLVGMDPSNRWIPEAQIAAASVTKGARARVLGIKGCLTLRMVDGERLRIRLTTDAQVGRVRTSLGKILGTRFTR